MRPGLHGRWRRTRVQAAVPRCSARRLCGAGRRRRHTAHPAVQHRCVGHAYRVVYMLRHPVPAQPSYTSVKCLRWLPLTAAPSMPSCGRTPIGHVGACLVSTTCLCVQGCCGSTGRVQGSGTLVSRTPGHSRILQPGIWRGRGCRARWAWRQRDRTQAAATGCCARALSCCHGSRQPRKAATQVISTATTCVAMRGRTRRRSQIPSQVRISLERGLIPRQHHNSGWLICSPYAQHAPVDLRHHVNLDTACVNTLLHTCVTEV